MNSLVLSSTFLLTLLLMVGLFFFVKASVKDRTQQAKLIAAQPEDLVLTQLQEYFVQRAYRVVAIDKVQEQITFEGVVRPSVFLAVFLAILVASGLLCLGLVLAILVPQVGAGFLGLMLLAPLASWFYWQKAQRPEQVLLKIEPFQAKSQVDQPLKGNSLLTVTAHRDELIELQSALKLQKSD
jgi:Flp pilus assembly protein TadB